MTRDVPDGHASSLDEQEDDLQARRISGGREERDALFFGRERGQHRAFLGRNDDFGSAKFMYHVNEFTRVYLSASSATRLPRRVKA